MNVVNTVLLAAIAGGLIKVGYDNLKPSDDGASSDYYSKNESATESPIETANQPLTDAQKKDKIDWIMFYFKSVKKTLHTIGYTGRTFILSAIGKICNLDEEDKAAFSRGEYDGLLNAIISIPNEQMEIILWNAMYAQRPIGKEDEDIHYDLIKKAIVSLRGKLKLPNIVYEKIQVSKHTIDTYLDDFNYNDAEGVPNIIITWLQSRDQNYDRQKALKKAEDAKHKAKQRVEDYANYNKQVTQALAKELDTIKGNEIIPVYVAYLNEHKAETPKRLKYEVIQYFVSNNDKYNLNLNRFGLEFIKSTNIPMSLIEYFKFNPKPFSNDDFIFELMTVVCEHYNHAWREGSDFMDALETFKQTPRAGRRTSHVRHHPRRCRRRPRKTKKNIHTK